MIGQQQIEENVKIVLLGDVAVGKTCLCNRYIKEIFNPNEISTSGAGIFEKQMEHNGKKYYLRIWDTAGQEVYRSLNKLYYQDARVAILVYDITKLSSFQNLQYWIDQLKQQANDQTCLAIVGNKLDMMDKEEVTYDEALQYSREQNATIFKVVSAKENKNIKELFTEILDTIQYQQQKTDMSRSTIIANPPQKNEEKKRCC